MWKNAFNHQLSVPVFDSRSFRESEFISVMKILAGRNLFSRGSVGRTSQWGLDVYEIF